RQISRLRPLQNLCDIGAGLSKHLGNTGRIADQAASDDVLTEGVHRHDLQTIGQRDDLVAVRKSESVPTRSSVIRCRENSANAASISASVLAFKMMSFTPKACAACCAFLTSDRKLGRVGLARKPKDVAAGTNSRSNSNRFAPSSLFKKLTPV